MSKERLNIAIVTNNYTPYSGGVVSSIDSFVDQLHAQGHKAFIITLDFLGDNHHDPYYTIRIPSKYRFMYKNNHMAIPENRTKKLENIITLLKPDIIHAQHPFFICKSALKIAKKQNIPIVFTYHTIYEQYLHYLPVPKFISRPIVKKIVLSFCKKVDSIIVPSNYIRDYLQTNKIMTRIEKIPSPILPIFAKNNSPLVIERINKFYNTKDANSENNFNLIVVSRFVKEKNIEFLLQLFAKLIKKDKNFTFTLVGYGNQYEKLKKYAYKKLKLQDNVIFIHKPRKQIIVDLYQQSDLFLFSSTSDTQGLVLAEAFACGCPIVTIDGPGQRDILKNGENGFLCKNQEQMLEKIILLKKDKILHQKLRIGAFETAKQYHPQYLTNKLITIYKQLI